MRTELTRFIQRFPKGADRRDESGDCGSAEAERYGRGRWGAVGGEEGQADKK